MGVSVEWQGGPVVIKVAGDSIVAHRQALRQHVEDAVRAGASCVVVDVGTADSVDSAGLGALAILARRARAAGGELHVAQLDPAVSAGLANGSLDTVLHLDDVDEADEDRANDCANSRAEATSGDGAAVGIAAAGTWISGFGHTVVVHVAGPLTTAARRDLRQLVLDALARGEHDVVVDVSGVEDIDSPALGTLAMLARRVRAAGGDFRLAHVTAAVGSVLALVKLDSVVEGDSAHHGGGERAAA